MAGPGPAPADFAEIDRLMAAGQFAPAAAACDAYLENNPQDGQAWLRRGVIYAQMRHLDDALMAWDKAAAIQGMGPALHYNMAGAKRDLGRLDESQAHLIETIRLNPKFYQAYQAYVRAMRFDAESAKEWLNPILGFLESEDLNADQAAELNFAASKIYDDIGDADNAWRHAVNANRARKGRMRFELERHERQFEKTEGAFPPELMTRLAGQGAITDESFIFIIGMPRSGTTLTEQILVAAGAHGAGERPDITRICLKLQKDLSLTWPGLAQALRPEILPGIGNAYARNLKSTNPNKTVFVDKCPTNYRFLGLVRLILPNAKFVWCRRHPLDVGLSCFMNDFNDQAFSFDLDHIAFSIAWQERLMAHWIKVAGPVLEWRYEDVIDDFEGRARALLDFVGLPWTPDVLEFQKADRSVSTASNWQVRQPLYKSSRGRAQAYREHLKPLTDALTARGVAVPD